jgi:hypothetical protein
MRRWTLILAVLSASTVSLSQGSSNKFQGLRVVQAGPVGLPSLRVDLVILGEGYIEADFKPQGKWHVDAARLVKNFFEKMPFKALRNLFNVHLVEVVSMDRGADDRPGHDSKRTAFDATYGFSGVARLLVCQNVQAVIQAAQNAPAVDMILVLVNDSRFGGSGGSGSEIPLSVCSTEPTAYETAIHELGHSIAGLADEYVDETVVDNYPLPSQGDFAEPNVTLLSRVDLSTPERMLETLKWSHFLEEPGAAKKYGKGYYEGGYYRSKGVLRPAASCIMGSQGGTGGFCFVCNAEMTRSLHRTAGRSAVGGVFPVAVARFKDRLRRPYFSYSQGAFANVLVDLRKIEKSGNLTPAETEGAAALRKGIEATFEEEVRKLREASSAGIVLEVRERLDLLTVSFRATPFEAQVVDIKKQLTSDPSFKKETEASIDLLNLEWGGKSLPPEGPQRKAWSQRVLAFRRKFEGTRAAERANQLLQGK